MNTSLDRIPDLLLATAQRAPEAVALRTRTGGELDYATLADAVRSFAQGLCGLGLQKQDRVAIYLNKRPETVAACFGTGLAGGVFVPVNPLLKSPQVGHILRDCAATVLVTTPDRLADLGSELKTSPSLRHIVTVGDDHAPLARRPGIENLEWRHVLEYGRAAQLHRTIDLDVASILYTSGSTGRPKGVVLSHRNMVAGARSVSEYLENSCEDRLLAVLPFSFDYGFSQLTTAFLVGAGVTLIDHLFARDVISAVQRDRITGLAAVPPLWIQLADLEWPVGITEHLRYITNSGGRMPRTTLEKTPLRPAPDTTISDVRTDRGLPRHLPAPGGDRQAAGFDRQGHS